MAKKLTKKAALELAYKKWGESAAVRDNRVPSSPELRQAAHDALIDHREQKPEMLPLKDWPALETVGAYRASLARYHQAYKEWKDEETRLFSAAMHYRYCVGRATWAFCIEGEGDTWEEALRKAKIEVPA